SALGRALTCDHAWSGRRDSNPRPQPWQGCALPAEPRPREPATIQAGSKEHPHMRIGVFGGDTAGRTVDDVIADARRAAGNGFASYALPQIFALDAMGVLAVVGREVPDIQLQTFVVPTYGRYPLTMAQQALTVQAASGNRFTLGIGLSHQLVIENMFGMS